jgi:ribosome-binding factor A
MDTKRMLRVAEAYQKEITQVLHQDVRDPRLNGVMVTHVIFTPDLRLAKVYFDVAGGRVREKEVLLGFEHSKGFLRRELSQRVRIKFTPDLKFYFDDSVEVNKRMDELFQTIEDQRHETSKED